MPAPALRGDVLPERVPDEGLLILRDGEPGEPDVTLSPLAYHYQHRAEIKAVVQDEARSAQQMQGSNDRDATFDTSTASIGAALAADRTLGGLCDRVEGERGPWPQMRPRKPCERAMPGRSAGRGRGHRAATACR